MATLKYHIFVIALSDWHVSATSAAGLRSALSCDLRRGAPSLFFRVPNWSVDPVLVQEKRGLHMRHIAVSM